eukprot:scaffold1031_cov461-Prasinococcus_capsulatus_cf.AAC.9
MCAGETRQRHARGRSNKYTKARHQRMVEAGHEHFVNDNHYLACTATSKEAGPDGCAPCVPRPSFRSAPRSG